MIERHDYVAMTDQELLDRSLELSEAAAQTYLTPERKADIQRHLGHHICEIVWRAGQNPAEIPVFEISDRL